MLGPAKLEGVYRMPTTRCHALGDIAMENKGKHIDVMMAALAKKNGQQHLEHKNPDGTQKITKPQRGTGPVSKPQKKVTGRGR